MREALQITEGNLTSLLGSRDSLGLTVENTVLSRAMNTWRDVVRKALAHFPSGSAPTFPNNQN